jgi:ATP-dependent Lon protease
MKESAQAALTWLRSHCEELGLEAELFERSDLHVHVPAGAIPKDGPSAGVTILAALASALTGRSLRPGLAMTGELTLRGSVLGVGGVVEKVLAARRAGLREIWVPEKNRRQIEEMPAHLREGLEFRFVADAGTLLHGVLGPEPARTRKAAAVG